MAHDLMTKQAIALAQAGEDINHLISPKYKAEERELIVEGARRGRDIGRFLIQDAPMTQDRGLGWDLIDAINSAGAGFENALINTAVAPYNIYKKITSAPGEFNPIEIDTDKYNLQGASKNKFVKGVGEFTGDIVAGALIPGGAVTKATKYLPKTTKLVGNADKLWNKLSKTEKAKVLALRGADIGAEGAMMGALYGARSKNTSLSDDMLTGAAVNYPTAAAFKAPSFLLSKYLQRSAKKARAGESEALTPEQVERIDQEIGDAPVDFGTIAGNKTMRGLYTDIVSHLPFSGAKEKAGKVVGALNKQGDDLKRAFGGDLDETEIPARLTKRLKKNEERYEEEVGLKFSAAQKIAEKSKLPMTEIIGLKKVAKKLYKEVQGRKSIPSETKKFIKEIANLGKVEAKEVKETNGLILPAALQAERSAEKAKKFSHVSFKKLDNIRKDLGIMARKAALDQDQTLHGLLSKLEGLTHNSIEESLKTNGAEEAVKLWKEGRQIHKNNVIPYRKPEIQKIIQGKKSDEKIHDILLKGDPENKKVFSHLPDNLVNQVIRLRLFGNSIENVGGKQRVNSKKLIREYAKLNKFQKRRAFTSAQREQLDRYAQLDKLAGTSKEILEPPKTGKYVYNAGVKALAFGLPALSGFKAHDEEYAPSGVPTALLSLFAGKAFSKKASKYFTSREGLRKDYIRGRATQSKSSKKAQRALARMITRGGLGDNPFED